MPFGWAPTSGVTLFTARSGQTERADPRQPTREVVASPTSNEFFRMRLASAAGIDAAPVELVFVPNPVLQIVRFDRRTTDFGIERVHTIDGCQTLGLPLNAKYERL